MALFTVSGIAMKGISSAVPKTILRNAEYGWIPESERNLLISTTGIHQRRVAPRELCTSDLCFEAAKRLMDELSWKAEEIGLLIFVSQSRDYVLPATSIILQDRLGIPKSCVAFDVGLGCSGYVYGLSIISAMLKSTGVKKALLMVGDISTSSLNYRDKSTYPLFGDAGTVTALELTEEQDQKWFFNLNSDGAGHKAIMIHDGGTRHPYSSQSEIEHEVSPGIWRSGIELSLEGLEVFGFSVREVPPNVNALLEYAQKCDSDIDAFVMHQANLLMNETIRKKLKFPKEKTPYSLDEFGNTSSASIPLTISTRLPRLMELENQHLLLSGFGVGLSWGSAIITTNHLVVPSLIEV